ncbi:MAG TPA: enoyl-CoA hydratase-related protein [Pyrinomonadaceae bacterium]|jgi:cyclohexa-1,5-dienecarbonyl-CoA hydratase|nr:enoyl-CoA hydratase-related protein [Pyrinomonadaceae bacterium]
MADNFNHIKFILEDRVGFITFASPPLNVLNIAMMQEVNKALDECSQQRDLAAIVFAAAPDCRAFSAGVSVEEHAHETIFQMLDSFHAIFRNLEQISRPTIAVVNGPALGGGCELITFCDFVIASEQARFGQPEIKLGVFPPVAAILLPRIVGDRRARELMLTGEIIEAREALALGLITRVVPAAELEAETARLLTQLRGLSALALEHAKRAIDLGQGRSLDEALKEIEDMYLHELMKTQDAVEGISAFGEKRKAAWQHR